MSLIFYHNADLDGHCSGAIVKKFTDGTLVPFNYGYDIPLDKIDDVTYLVDISFPVADMLKLANITKLIWIDHHQLPQELRHLPTLHRIGTAACELCWEYFTKVPVPKAVKLLSSYDVWNLSEEVLDFQYGMKQYDTDPRVFNWEPIFNGDWRTTVADGRVIRRYQREQDTKLCFVEHTFHGYPCLYLNHQQASSLTFPKFDGILMKGYFDGKWHYSLYTERDDINCCEIARQYGGGGHRKAAGFTTKEPV